MKYFLMSDDEKKILIYEYKAIKEKLYEYKKERLNRDYIKSGKFKYTYEPGPYKVLFEMVYPNEISSKIQVNKGLNMSLDEYNKMVKNVCNLDFRRELITSNDEREKYIEAYANGDLKLSHTNRNDMWDCLETYPEIVNVHKDYEQSNGYAKYHVDPVFVFGPELLLLTDLEEGKFRRAYYYPSYIDNQFECFEFNTTPIDEISISSLELLSDNVEKAINLAKENATVLEKSEVKVYRK